MGEIADAMLDGTLCEWCGVFIETGSGGFPMICEDCFSVATPVQRHEYQHRHEGCRGRKCSCAKHPKETGTDAP